MRDAEEEARLDGAPITGWRAASVAAAFVVIAAITIAALVILVASGVSPLLIGLFLLFEVTVAAKLLTRRRARR